MAHKLSDRVTAQFPELEPVITAATELRLDRRRYAFHAYLSEVYRAGRLWSLQKVGRRRKRRLAKLAQINTRRDTNAFRVIIEATFSSLEKKQMSRWTRALEFALAERVRPSELATFFGSKGGVATCARHAAFELPKRDTYRKTWD